MRLMLSLAATLLLVGAGCNSTTTTTTTTDVATQTPIIGATVENNTVVTSSPVVVSTTMTAPIVKPEVKPIVEAKVEAKTEAKVEPKVCTMEAKLCPDGSSVGRTGPNCEFAACPVVKVEEKPVETGPKTYTMAEVQAQAAAGKCWTVINAKVYDLSSWISKHPGGLAAIQSLCGINGTAKFTAMHGGAAKQEAILTTFLVGSLK